MISLLPCMFEFKHTMEEAIPTLQASVRAQKARKVKRLTGAGEYILVASNSLGLSWESAMSKLTEVESLGESSKIVPLSLQQLKAFPSIKDMCHHSGLRCIPRTVLQQQYDLKEDDTLKKVIQQLVDVFPLLGVVKGAQFVLIDYTELVFNPNVVHELLTLKQDNEQSDKEDSPVPLLEKPAEGIMFYKKTGPQPLQEKFPQLLDVIVNFVRLHGFGAHTRKRSGTSTSCGVSLEDIRRHVECNVDGLTKISKTKIYHLMKPARSNSREAARHKDALDIRVASKVCDVSKDSQNAHEYFALVSNIRQMAAIYPNECVIFSCDSKAKIHIGGQAVSRYHQLKTFFPDDDCPHYADHDFPIPGYKIEPDGYLMLQSKQNPAPIIHDKLGRDVVEVPSTGPLWVYNRCTKSMSTTIVHHIHDIENILESNPDIRRPVLLLITDGGPDWTPKSNVNQFFLGRLWREGNFDMLVAACEPPGLSRYNPIEHLWSPCSKFLAGVSLPACLPGETVPPSQQTISPREKKQKEGQVFDNAFERLNMYWDGKIHDGFRITSIAVKQDQESGSGMYPNVQNMFQSSLRTARESQDTAALLEEWKYLVRHMDRRRGFVCFRKGGCGDPSCECISSGITASEVWKVPSGERWLFPPITPDPSNVGHYMTFHQLQTALSFSRPDQHLKDGVNTQCSKCRYGQNVLTILRSFLYSVLPFAGVFSSKADEEKHIKLVHGGVRLMNKETREENSSINGSDQKRMHKCPVCREQFPTQYQLRKHQDRDQHKLKRGRPAV